MFSSQIEELSFSASMTQRRIALRKERIGRLLKDNHLPKKTLKEILKQAHKEQYADHKLLKVLHSRVYWETLVEENT